MAETTGEHERLRLYAYATAQESGDDVRIMREFAGALLAEWSALDVIARGIDLPAEVVEQRLRHLAGHGNLLVSPREVRVSSIADYRRQPARHTATSLGVRVHRQVEEVLAAAGGAREVPRELLAAVADRLTALAALGPDGIGAAEPAELSENVSTAFLQFESFAAAGVRTDEVSTTALTIGLWSQSGDTWLDVRTASGWETHLTSRDLRRVELRPPADRKVFVCENPRVLELAIDRGTTAAAVCTQGQPAIVVLVTLERLRAAGAELWYHGDFDWPGISIAQHMIGVHGCLPWRMAASDYLDGLAKLAPLAGDLPALEGAAVLAGWDPELTAEMSRANRTIHEELLLDDLLADMA